MAGAGAGGYWLIAAGISRPILVCPGCWNQLSCWVPNNNRNVLSLQRRKSESKWQQAPRPFQCLCGRDCSWLLSASGGCRCSMACGHITQSLLVFTPPSPLHTLALFSRLSFKDACDGLQGLHGQFRKRYLLSWKVMFRGFRNLL